MKLLLFFFVSSVTHAALDMKPGLWSVEMKVHDENKTMDMAQEMKKAMAKMTPEQKRAMMNKIGKNAGLGEDGKMQICYSKKLIENPEVLARSPGTSCKTSVIKDTTTQVVTRFKCEDGSSGNSTWTVKNSKAYKGLLHMVSPQGAPSDIKYTGEFISSDCGKIQPVL